MDEFRGRTGRDGSSSVDLEVFRREVCAGDCIESSAFEVGTGDPSQRVPYAGRRS